MKNYFACFTFLLFINACLPNAVVAGVSSKYITTAAFYQEVDSAKSKQDTLPKNTKVIDSVVLRNYVSKKIIDSIDVKKAALYPFNSLQQALKASVSGVFVQEPNGEPGTSEQWMLIRGISRPFFTQGDVALAQPAIFVNGIPLMQDNTFSSQIQKYDFSPLGSATNLLSTIDLDNVASIHVVKGLEAAAIYGPRAANGAILITTKNAHEGKREISFSSAYGFVDKDMVTTTNGVDESNFRKIFYDKFASAEEKANIPGFLSDASNENYYGASNWTDLYYKRAPIYSINGSIT
ncbi:TonB-dependent receptor plug domain-containing protein [Pedobacter sp. SL55]|uniref:TonB-dependent receptor plug domain-containing protein n=1 Tax=Pedobacter sp. SL55 TaxID=2995161 RepID=UPI002271C634|nr:TonB-dependent receptor plug domain-containing protein [Pedobacter sp. SL55]WAC41310.1 TonB-dependent receptor plug domain-containing protein [Pedobacter sp. SL55]